MAENLKVVVEAPKGYENAPATASSKGFWHDSEVGCAINFRLLGMAPEGVAKTSKSAMVEVELLQPTIVNSKPEGSTEQVQVIAQKGDVVWINVRYKIDLLTRFAIAGMNPDVYLRVEKKIKTKGGNDMYEYTFQHSPDAYKQLLSLEKREKDAEQLAGAAPHALS